MVNSTSRSPPSMLRLAAGLLAALGFWAMTFLVASGILARDPAAVGLRGAAVAAAVIGLLVWIWMTARSIAAQDEFSRRIHTTALSWAFAVTAVFVVTVDFLSRAHLIGYVSYTTTFLFMVVAWWVAMMAAARYYR
jgi:hypothetical protein